MADSLTLAVIFFAGVGLLNQLIIIFTLHRIKKMLKALAEAPGEFFLDLIDGVIDSMKDSVEVRNRVGSLLAWVGRAALAGATGQDPNIDPQKAPKGLGKWMPLLQIAQGLFGKHQAPTPSAGQAPVPFSQ